MAASGERAPPDVRAAARESDGGAARVSIAELVGGGGGGRDMDAGEARGAAEAEAAEALGRLRDSHGGQGHQFMQRVQAIPIVNSALEMYDRSRQSSALIRVGGSVIETGVRRMCEPIARRIDVAQLDDFACRQLTNLGYSSESGGGGGGNMRKRTKDQVDRPA
ncbi:transcriptional regulator opi1, partial [Coemansia javaensis]